MLSSWQDLYSGLVDFSFLNMTSCSKTQSKHSGAFSGLVRTLITHIVFPSFVVIKMLRVNGLVKTQLPLVSMGSEAGEAQARTDHPIVSVGIYVERVWKQGWLGQSAAPCGKYKSHDGVQRRLGCIVTPANSHERYRGWQGCAKLQNPQARAGTGCRPRGVRLYHPLANAKAR